MNKIICFILSLFFVSISTCFALETDFLVDEFLKDVEVEKPITNEKYNYVSYSKIPVKLQIEKNISTKKDKIYEGQIINFIIKEDVKHNHKVIIEKGTHASAVVETFMSRGMNGVPAVIILDKFEIQGLDKSKLKGTYTKKGQNRGLLVFPIKWALTPIPFVGSITNVILGGHAKIKTKNTVEIYYFPDWNEK